MGPKMQARAAVAALGKMGTRQHRANLDRFGITTSKAFGVSMTDIQALARRLGRSHDLAAALWDTGWYEARMLASFVDEPDRVTAAQMDRWCRDFDNWAICDTVCFKLFDRTPHAWSKVPQWSRRREEFVRRAGFALLASLAGHDKTAPNARFGTGLRLIERHAGDSRNFVKKGVSWALRRIGTRNTALHTDAVVLAARLAASDDASTRWVGKDALRDLTRPLVTRRLARSVALALLLQFGVVAAAVARQPPAAAPPAFNPDIHYQLGPDSYPRDGVPKGEVRGPFTLPSDAYPGTRHTYWVYVPAQYDARTSASLMVFNDGQAFKNMDGDLRAPNVLDNLIYRREIPVMIAVFINPGRRPDQPEPTPQNWGDRDTNRPAEYNSLDDKYARVVVDELMPVLYKEYNLSRDPERHGIGGASSGAIAAFTVAWQRPAAFHKVLSMIGSFTNLRGGHAYAEIVRTSEKKPLRVYLQDGRNDNRGAGREGNYDETRDWFLQNTRLMRALSDKGYDLNYTWGIGRHGQKQAGAIMPDMMRWLWRDHPVSTDPNDAVERAFNEPSASKAVAPAPAVDPAVAELLRLETAWNEGHLRGDADAIAALCTDDMTITVPGMPVMTRPQAIAVLKSGQMRFDRYETSNVTVRPFGSSAAVSGRLQRRRTVNGRTTADDWQFTKMYVRAQGKWVVAAFHASNIR